MLSSLGLLKYVKNIMFYWSKQRCCLCHAGETRDDDAASLVESAAFLDRRTA